MMTISKNRFTLLVRLVLLGMVFGAAGCDNSATQFSLPSTSQSYGQTVIYNNKVDILFVIDNSASMSQYQKKLALGLPQLIDSLNSLEMDYHVAVTTTTMAKNSSYSMSRQIIGSPKHLTRSNIDLLESRILAGEKGSDAERGLDALAFVTADYAKSEAVGFIRSDALFVTIILADEDDQSSEFGDGAKDDFINYMNGFKPNFKEGGRAWIAHYIGTIKAGQTCDIFGGYVSVGAKYMKLADYSGGIKESICSADFSAAVSNIKARVIERITTYRLKDVPNKSSIKVYLGGAEIFEDAVNGWTLETETTTNAATGTSAVVYLIKFHGSAIPASNVELVVAYTPANAS